MPRLLRRTCLLLAAVATLAAVPVAWGAPPDEGKGGGLTGHYYLEGGSSEVGSELLLKDGGKFEWALMYGAVDQFASGAWRLDGDRVVLTSGPKPAPVFRLFGEDDYHGTKPAEPGRWIAIVGVPHVGPVADVEVKFEARSGKSATAVSKRNGDAIVEMPANETWARAGVRGAGSGAPWQWLPVDAERAGKRIVGIALTNVEAVQQAPFSELVLRREAAGLVVDDPESGLRGTYARH